MACHCAQHTGNIDTIGYLVVERKVDIGLETGTAGQGFCLTPYDIDGFRNMFGQVPGTIFLPLLGDAATMQLNGFMEELMMNLSDIERMNVMAKEAEVHAKNLAEAIADVKDDIAAQTIQFNKAPKAQQLQLNDFDAMMDAMTAKITAGVSAGVGSSVNAQLDAQFAASDEKMLTAIYDATEVIQGRLVRQPRAGR
jgi:hypothetical protein